jgi:hypothetical protein
VGIRPEREWMGKLRYVPTREPHDNGNGNPGGGTATEWRQTTQPRRRGLGFSQAPDVAAERVKNGADRWQAGRMG